MKLQFRSNDREGRQWRQHTASRMRQALGRLHGLVARMKVRLDDVNGPAGGVDKRCNVEVQVQGAGPVALSATARTWQASVDAAVSRLRQRIVLQLHRATVIEQPAAALAPIRIRAALPAAGVRMSRRLRPD
jgi:hypothetical protein